MIASDFSDVGDFIRDVLSTTLDACRMPSLWVPAVTFSIAMDLAAAAANWPFRDGQNPPPEHAITVMALLILGKGWFSLTLCRIALAGLRGHATGVLNQWVSVQEALRIGFVTIVFLSAILAGIAFLVVPGLYLLGRWSQVTLVLIDGRAQWFEAGDESAYLSTGFRPAILIVLMVTATFMAFVKYLLPDLTVVAWAYRAAASTIGAGLAAAVYYELSRRDVA